MKGVIRGQWACVAAIILAWGLGGCSENNGQRQKIQRVEGVAKTIDLKNNQVSMMARDDKGQEREVRGTIREDTEVWINGRSQKLEDVKPGDKVVVFGYSEGIGENKKLVATKVEVTRTRDEDWKTTGQTVAQKPTAAAVKPAAPSKQMPPSAAAVQQTAAARSGADAEQARTQTTGAIYEEIRKSMQEAMQKKAELLKAGKTPSDPEVRELDQKIRNAEEILNQAPTKATTGTDKDDDALREKTTDAIYAQIRIRMEDAIAKRAEMLKAGKDRSDPEVRKHEETILRARTLLMEAGEVVAPINPPIIETPPPAQTGKPAAQPAGKP